MDAEQVKNMAPEERAMYDAQVLQRVIRFKDVLPNWDLSPNCRLPGYERANLVYVGGGPYLDLQVEPNGPHPAPVVEGENYSVIILLCAPGKGAPLHAHTTEEMFLSLSSRWAVYWGEEDVHEVILEPWDAVSFPGPVMRGFRNVGPEDGYLLSVIGGGSPPPPISHASVISELAKLGLKQSWKETYST
jgi:mannose-6-phosphate isomerase-like protein (cupin superfamily)